MTQLHPQARPVPLQHEETAFPEQLVCGTQFMEVVLTQGSALSLPGWTLRLWPQARLADATLEARPTGSQETAELIAGLRSLGVQVLGPVRTRKS